MVPKVLLPNYLVLNFMYALPVLMLAALSHTAQAAGCVDADGHLYTWGSNAYGQVGLTAPATCSQPQMVTPRLPLPTRILILACSDVSFPQILQRILPA